jgi:hypothetical protein
MLSPDELEQGGFINGFIAAAKSFDSYGYQIVCSTPEQKQEYVNAMRDRAIALYNQEFTNDGIGSRRGDPERRGPHDSGLVQAGDLGRGEASQDHPLSAGWSGAEVWHPVQEDDLGVVYPSQVRAEDRSGSPLSPLGIAVALSIPLWMALTAWLGRK